jgi:putative ABC transport system permease protein
MNTLKLAIRNSFRKNGSNLVKILSLGIGLTIGLVLIAKIIFELSYDSHYIDSDRIYKVYVNYATDADEMDHLDRTPGAIAWAMKNEIPEIENSTRYTTTFNYGIFTENKEYLTAHSIIADENLFDILSRPILIGNAKEILSLPMHCLVSKSIALKIGMENIVGKVITLENHPTEPLIIGGIFEDIPENSTHQYDVVIPMKSISNFTWDGSENWLGNERYCSFVKIKSGVQPESLAPQVTSMLERNVDMVLLEKAGVEIDYAFDNIKAIHKGEINHMILIFGLLVIVLLTISILNYTLVVVSSLVNRTKEIAVHKCYGAKRMNISKLLFTETLIHLILALAFSTITIILLEDIIKELLQNSIQALFVPQIVILLALICVIILLITGFFPAYLFSKIPVTAAFQKPKETHRKWKSILIFCEVAVASFIISLLMMIGLQYNKFINADQGYSWKNLLYVSNVSNNPSIRKNIVQELKTMSEVKEVSMCSNLPYWGASGNNILEIGNERNLFNIADFYYVDENFLSVMEIPIIEGKGFVKGETGQNVMMVSESFVGMMEAFAGWKDGVIGKSVFVSEHRERTICGVFGNIYIQPQTSGRDMRPAILHYDPNEEKPDIFLIKMNQITPEIVETVYGVFHKFVPEANIVVNNYEERFKDNFSDIKIYRSGILICSIATLFIALIGLIGYFHVETNRRRSEIAIRKINGATINSIQSLFLNNILKIIIPAIIVGIVVSVFVSKIFQKNFADKVHISLLLYILCAVCIAFVIIAVVSLNIYRAAARNPVENLVSG